MDHDKAVQESNEQATKDRITDQNNASEKLAKQPVEQQIEEVEPARAPNSPAPDHIDLQNHTDAPGVTTKHHG